MATTTKGPEIIPGRTVWLRVKGKAVRATVIEPVGNGDDRWVFDVDGYCEFATPSQIITTEEATGRKIPRGPALDAKAAAPLVALKIVDEIRLDILRGIVPDTVASFSELHDHVDANMYAFTFCSVLTGNDEVNDARLSVMNAALDIVDAFIRRGGFVAPNGEDR